MFCPVISSNWLTIIVSIFIIAKIAFYEARAMVQLLRQTAHDQKVVGLNPSTKYWMDVSNARLAIT
jgi:hypothetical protein